MMSRPTRSPVLFQQMLGRGLRLYDGKTDCLCIDIVDNTTKNAIITLPSLMGLAEQFDAKGADIYAVSKEIKELAAVNKSINIIKKNLLHK